VRAAELRLHLIHPLGFTVDDKRLKRAGLDYWSEIDLCFHASFEAFLASKEAGQLIAFSSHGSQITQKRKSSRGLSALRQRDGRSSRSIREAYPCYRIPSGKGSEFESLHSSGNLVYHHLHVMADSDQPWRNLRGEE